MKMMNSMNVQKDLFEGVTPMGNAYSETPSAPIASSYWEPPTMPRETVPLQVTDQRL
jgi:hypothetical protein